MKLIKAAAVFVVLQAQPTNAEPCASYAGQRVSPRDIDDILAPFRAMGSKSEFESTQQFESRKLKAARGIDTQLIVKKAPEDRKHLVYDADAQLLNVIAFAFRNAPLNSPALFRDGKTYDGGMGASAYNIEAVIEQDETVTGTYKASNAFGATMNVQKIFRRTRGIYESTALPPAEDLFPAAQDKPYYAGSIPMTPEQAMKIKPTLQLAFVVVPKAPFFLSTTFDIPLPPTVTRPAEVKNEVSALIADIQCGLVIDPTGTVLGAFETR